MGAEPGIGTEGLSNEIRPLRLDADIDVLAPVAVWPAVEAVLLHGGQVVRHEVGPDLVALVGDRPELAGGRLEGEVGWIADAARIDPLHPGGAIHLPDG